MTRQTITEAEYDAIPKHPLSKAEARAILAKAALVTVSHTNGQRHTIEPLNTVSPGQAAIDSESLYAILGARGALMKACDGKDVVMGTGVNAMTLPSNELEMLQTSLGWPLLFNSIVRQSDAPGWFYFFDLEKMQAESEHVINKGVAHHLLNTHTSRRMRVVDPGTHNPVEMEVITLDLIRDADVIGINGLHGTALAGKHDNGDTGFYRTVRNALDGDSTLVVERIGGLGHDGDNRVELSVARLQEIAGIKRQPELGRE